MPETSTTQAATKPKRPGPHSRTIPLGAETTARFAPSASALGSAYAETILAKFRKELEGVDLKASPAKRKAAKKS